jgi:hypothetical protein
LIRLRDDVIVEGRATPRENIPHGRFSHFDTRPLEVFFETGVELLQPSKFKICHALFFGFGIAPIPHRIRSWHVGFLQG